MSVSSGRKRRTCESTYGHSAETDRGPSMGGKAETSRSDVSEPESTEIRKSSRKRTSKRFDDFYVDITGSDDREKRGETSGKGDIKSPSKRVKHEPMPPDTSEDVKNVKGRTKNEPAPSEAVGDTIIKKRGRKPKSKPLPSDAVAGSTDDAVIQKSPESTQPASQVTHETEDGQLRKSSRKRTPKCFDSSFIDDRKSPKKRQTINPKRCKRVGAADTRHEKETKVKEEDKCVASSSEIMQRKEEDSAQSGSGLTQCGDDGEMQMNGEKNSVEDKPEPIPSDPNTGESSDESAGDKSVQSHDGANDDKANDDTVDNDDANTADDDDADESGDKEGQLKEQSSYSDSKPENNDPGLQNGKVRKRRKRRTNRSRKCEVCAKVFQKVADLDKHMLVHTGEKPFVCDVCGKRFTQLGNMKAHKMIHTGERPFQCDICGKAFVRAGDLKCHRVKHSSEKTFRCDVCPKAFKTAEYLRSHKEIHTNLRPFKCDECGKGFLKLGSLKAHKVIHTGIKSFKCSMCSKSFYTAGNLKEHENLHTGVKPFCCEVCGSKFTKKSSLKKHTMLHTGERPFTCDYCSKGYTNRGEWEIHRRTHTGERPYECDRCDATFHRKANLLQHISAVHLGVRPYICNVCGKAFTEARCLKEHLLIHSGEKPHRCEKCDKAFTQSSTLKAHMRSHSGDKPYPCMYCPKTFSDVSSRNRHHRMHTGEKPYKCLHCSSAFARLELCKRHMQHEHNVHKTVCSVAVGKRSPTDHSYDVPVTSVGQSEDVKTLTLVTDDVDVKPPIFSTGAEQVSVQHQAPLQISSQEFSGMEQFVITVTDGTQIILQTDVNNLPQISAITEHLSNDHPYVVTSQEGLGHTDGAGVTVIEVQVIDEQKVKPEQGATVPHISIVNQPSDVPSRTSAVSLLGESSASGSVQSSVINTSGDSQDHGASATAVVQSFSDPASASYFPVTQTQASDSGDALSLTYIKSEVDTVGVPESVIVDSRGPDIDSLHTVVVKSEDDIGNVLSGPVILESEVGSGTKAMTYTVVTSQGNSSQQTMVSETETGHAEEATYSTVVTEVDNSGALATLDDDQAQVEPLEEDESHLASAEELLDTSRTILRDLLTDPASTSAAATDKSDPGGVVKTTVGVLRMKKRRYAAVPKGFFCEVCGHGFTQASSLKKHQILLHSADKPFVCEVCQKGCTSRSELEMHSRSHTGEKPFKCGHCGVTLRRKANLEQHIRAVHMQHRPHRCEVCGRHFTEARSLKDHKLIHLGAKPHKCSCGKAFTQLGTLKKHQRTHTGLKEYQCTVCTKRFTDPAALRRHVRLHTGERPYKCEYCSMAFFRSEQLRTHKRNEHPDNLDDLASIALATSI